MRRTLYLLLGLLAGAPVVSHAQTAWPTSVDIGVGPASGWGGKYADRSGVALSLAITPSHASAFTTVFAAGYYSSMAGNGDDCVFVDGECIGDDFPTTYHASALFGASYRKGVTSFRALLGPALFFGETTPGIGPQAQVDVALGKGRVEAMGGYRASAIIRSEGKTQGLGAVILGLRIH